MSDFLIAFLLTVLGWVAIGGLAALFIAVVEYIDGQDAS